MATHTGPGSRGECRGQARLLPRRATPAGVSRTRRRIGFARAIAVLVPGVAMAMLASAASAGTLPTTGHGPARSRSGVQLRHPAHASQAPAFCHAGGARLWARLAACGWPGRANTGPRISQCPSHRLTRLHRGLGRAIVITTPNAVISCRQITGMLDIKASGVTVKDSTIVSNSGKRGQAANGTADIYVEDGASAVIDHVKINGDDGVHACVWHQGTQLTVDAVNCYGVDDGIFSWADTGYSPTTGDHFTIRNSYFHGFTHATANGHEDGYQTEGASHGLIEHNTYRMNAGADSAIAIWDSLKSASDITVTGNLITGGGFAVYAEDYNPGDGGPGEPSPIGGFGVTGITFTGNAFSTFAAGCVGKYGAWFTRPAWDPYEGGPTDGWHRVGNRVLETGENIDGHNPTWRGTLCR
jgi:Right handed beta helix region